jgi:hypothetical protein
VAYIHLCAWCNIPDNCNVSYGFCDSTKPISCDKFTANSKKFITDWFRDNSFAYNHYKYNVFDLFMLSETIVRLSILYLEGEIHALPNVP